MRGDVDVLSTAKFADRFENVRFIEIKDETNFLALLRQVGTVTRGTERRLVESEALAVFQQKGLHVTRRRNIEFGGAGVEHEWAPALHFNFDLRRLSRCRLRSFLGWLRFVAGKQERSDDKDDYGGTYAYEPRVHGAP